MATAPAAVVTRPRDHGLERRLTALAVQAASLPSDGGLGRFADQRARAGGVHADGRDFAQEMREEIADARNYAVWGIEAIHDRYLAGDQAAAQQYVALMTSLRALVVAWDALRAT